MVLRRHDHSAPARRTLCVGRELTMPELPEVETLQRGPQPVMEEERFVEVVAGRGDLRWPLGKDFAARVDGQAVEAHGGRARCVRAALAAAEVLEMDVGLEGK